MKKGGGPAPRKELGDIGYLESHPKVCQIFKDLGCYRFCENIHRSHQQVVQSFTISFDGSRTVIGKEEFQVDEALIVEVTELPRTGETWFKTTIIKNVEFRSYLKPEHKNIVWKKRITTS